MIYLDHAATSPPLHTAMQAFYNAAQNFSGNPNSVHELGRQANRQLEGAKNLVAYCLSCDPEQVIFTSSASQACDLAMRSMFTACEKIEIVDTDHAATYGFLEKEISIPTRHLGGRLPKAISHIHTSNEPGQIFSIERIPQDYDFIFSDCTAAMGKSPICFKTAPADLIAGGGHKFGSPVGVGVLIARDPEAVRGAYHPATPSVPLAMAFAQALHFRTQHLALFGDVTARLHDRFVSGIMNEISDAGLNGKFAAGNEQMQSPYIASISFPGIENHALVLRLSADGLMASSGAACDSGKNEVPRVLLAEGYTENRARSTVRFSFDYKLDLTADELQPNFGIDITRDFAIIDEAVRIVARNVKEMRK